MIVETQMHCGSYFTHEAQTGAAPRSDLDVVVLAQVGRLQVEVAEVEFDAEAVGDAEVPAELRLRGIRFRKVWRLQAAVRV